MNYYLKEFTHIFGLDSIFKFVDKKYRLVGNENGQNAFFPKLF